MNPDSSMPTVRAARPAAALQTLMLLPAILGGRLSGSYVLQALCRLPGQCDPVILERAFRLLCARHDILSASFQRDGGGFILRLHELARPRLLAKDLSQAAPGQTETVLDAFLDEDRGRGFDVSAPPLHRLTLLRLPDGKDALVWTAHHAVADGTGLSLGLRQLLADYRALSTGALPGTEPAPAYGPFLDWLTARDRDAAIAFYRERLMGAAEAHPLPFRPAHPGRGWGEARMTLPPGQGPALARLAESAEGGLGAVVQAAWTLVLARHTGDEAIFFGAVRSLRHWSPASAAMLGPCMNVTPRRVAVSPDQPLLPWLRALAEDWRAGREHAHLDLAGQRLAAGLPANGTLYESILVYSPSNLQDDLETSAVLPGAQARMIGRTPVPLALSVTGRDGFAFTLEHDLERVDKAQAERLLASLAQALQSLAAAQPQAPLQEIDVLPPSERQQVATAFGRNTCDFPEGQDPYALLTAPAERSPGAVAVDGPAGTWNWAELMEQSGRLARLLHEQGVRPGDRVALCLPRTPWAVAAMLAALRAGACYVPLDPAYPAERVNYILEDSAARLVLVAQGSQAAVLLSHARILELDCARETLDGLTPLPAVKMPGDAPAYLVYTSGTTGQPKGVVIPRRALSAYLRGSAGLYALRPDDRMLQFASLSFDASAEEILCALAAGATLVLRDEDCLASVAAFLDFLRQWRVTTLALPTSFWRLVVEGLGQHSLPDNIRQLTIGCEQAPRSALLAWQSHAKGRVRLLNTYGPTETTVVATGADLTGHANGDEPPIGYPLPSVRAYVCLPDMRLAPVGTPGELCLAGPQLAAGYLNKPERTHEAFALGPFAEIPEERVYRTGDLARWRDDGQLAIMGRRDRQIKIRGFRVELSEIEAALAAEPDVQSAAVKDFGEGAAKSLLAWVVLHDRSTEPMRGADLSARLARRLPAYMRPARITLITEMPLNAHDKIDYRGLDVPELPDIAHDFMDGAPESDDLETLLAGIWRRELHLSALGLDDDFFELGGDSLAALSTLARIEKELAVGLPAQALFTARTVRRLAGMVRAVQKGVRTEAEPALDPIQPDGSRAPLFFVGANLLLPPLAKALGPDQPLWSLNIFGLQPTDGATPDIDVPGIASRYIEELKAVRPHGPYYLSAYCLDAKLAFEMARQLSEAGESVPFLGFLDGVWTPESGAMATGRHLRNLLHFGPDYLRHKLRQKWRQWRIDARLAISRLRARLAGDPSGHSAALRNALFVDAFYTACDRYDPAPYQGPITLYLSWEWRSMRLRSLSELAAGSLAVHEVPGYHDGWFEGEQVKELARLLRADMDRAGAAEG